MQLGVLRCAECLEENYDSDSSLAAAVNKSLDLGRSLEDKCAALNDLQVESSEDEERGGDVAVEVPQHAGPIKVHVLTACWARTDACPLRVRVYTTDSVYQWII